ncbi:MAG TPA: hypothetical protein VLD65_12785 [Anaerolineales bacterium]|nr:hypothetical protein [Anaerolineales bacterium]
MITYLQIGFVFLIVLLMITVGLIYIFRKDWAWWYTERMLRSVKPQRTREWERNSTMIGVILTAFGLISFLFLLSIL